MREKGKVNSEKFKEEDMQAHVAEAQRLIAETGYHRRDAELAELLRATGIEA